jgi:hypothetical protein
VWRGKSYWSQQVFRSNENHRAQLIAKKERKKIKFRQHASASVPFAGAKAKRFGKFRAVVFGQAVSPRQDDAAAVASIPVIPSAPDDTGSLYKSIPGPTVSESTGAASRASAARLVAGMLGLLPFFFSHWFYALSLDT